MAIECPFKINTAEEITGFINIQIKGKTDLICRIRTDSLILAEPFLYITVRRYFSCLELALQIAYFLINIACISNKTICTQK